MAEQYPFPLPEAIQNEADRVIERLGNHPGSYLCYPPGANPQCLDAFDNCLLELSIIHEVFDSVGDNLSGKDASLLCTATNALEAELDRMEQLLVWGRLTWKYDPAIQRAFNGDSLPPVLEPGTSKEASA